jgi:hypothetical protein
MKKDQIKLGASYSAKVSDKLVTVRIDGENPHGGWDATNLATGKKVRIKSAQRLRAPAGATSSSPKPTSAPSPAAAPGKSAKAKSASAKAAPKAKATKMRKASGLDLAAQVLAKAKEPLSAKDIAERVIAAGWKTKGATPQATLHAAIGREIAAKGKEARFRKTGRGLFTTNRKEA